MLFHNLSAKTDFSLAGAVTDAAAFSFLIFH